jgi:ribosome-binding factor A
LVGLQLDLSYAYMKVGNYDKAQSLLLGVKSRNRGSREENVADLLLRRSKDPRLAPVSITRVALTPDLRLARIAYTILGEDDRREVQRALVGATPFLKRGVAEALALRHVPDLAFAYDEVLEGARRIDALLRDLRHDEPSVAVADTTDPAAFVPEEEDPS